MSPMRSLNPHPSTPPLSGVPLPRLSGESTRRHSSSSSRGGGRSLTDPDPSRLKIKKRIIVCCDGYLVHSLRRCISKLSTSRTWQDGISAQDTWQYTNILVCLPRKESFMSVTVSHGHLAPFTGNQSCRRKIVRVTFSNSLDLSIMLTGICSACRLGHKLYIINRV